MITRIEIDYKKDKHQKSFWQMVFQTHSKKKADDIIAEQTSSLFDWKIRRFENGQLTSSWAKI